eukprot:CAMPEP_0113615096 /NCGR_PEP_ID=MMETSP0017_2-20120614/7518_1 /TAXON_ID=2856 /ORGANISM="Cylindrotheca closterium" /LENGTH=397 /DNA_ID=CAMNT_0000524309 /DNA_START=108 /DNA_END=1301 /DNA_ORIENTATION=+ /assembly_acc=CAM_ASM_000147
MTAANPSADTFSVEVPSHEPKETESISIDTTTAAPLPAEDATQTVDNTAAEASIATSTEPSSSEESSQGWLSERPEEEEKDDKEEEQGEPGQRMPSDIASQRRMEQEKEIETATEEVIEPMKMLRKGATAVVGGAMVGVGLVMIPLPTPMGCVVASSGMAVLGSEFEGAKEMNDRMIEKSKTHLGNARDKAIAKLESMNSNDEETDDDSVGSEEEEAPAWLQHMNEAERKRQRKLMKQKYREETLSTTEQLKEVVTKRTSSFLSRNILPALHRTKNWGKEEGEDTAESAEGAPETPSASEAFQKGKEKMSESFVKGKEQMRSSFISTSASFSSMMKRMSPQSAGNNENSTEFDEEINFGENAKAKDAAFKDDIAAPVAATGSISASAESAAASVVTI